jgi:phosphoribosylglycinamide formyltransferase-1
VPAAGKPMRIVFLVSGGGGNLRAVHRVASGWPECGFAVVGVVGDRESGATAWSRAQGIPTAVAPYSRQDSAAFDDELARLAPERIVTNFHRILGAATLQRFEGRFVNLHYSELPRHAAMIGEAPVRAALDAGDSFIGTTVHRVIEAVDAGPVLGRTRTPVVAGEPFEALMTRVFRAGAWNLADALAREAGGALPGRLVDGQGLGAGFWAGFA